MKHMKKFMAILLAVVIIVTAGILTTGAVNTTEEEVTADDVGNKIIVHYKSSGGAVPTIYYWNSLPQNIETEYPGPKMTADANEGTDWYTYTFNDITKINMLFIEGDNVSKELTRQSTGEYWYKNNRWYTSNPDKLDPVERTDFREDTIYFVLTTRFYDGDSGNNVHCWDDNVYNNPDSDPAWRGDFKGLIDKLDYIKALGFSAIWVTPVVTNGSGYDYHGYHALDFSTVDVRYESDGATFQDLINAVHEKDMKIIQDIVLQHTGNFGEATFEPLFEKKYDTIQDLGNIQKSMIPSERLLSEYGLSSAEEYYAQPGSVQHDQRLRIMKDTDITAQNAGTSDDSGIAIEKEAYDRVSHSDKYNKNNYYHNNYWVKYNWDDYSTQYCQIAGDCVDLNTENPEVGQKLVDIYSDYINMGVDAFRVDTARHISRLSLNTMFTKQLNAVGGENFYMFGEVCTRHTDIWYRGMASESTPFYTWAEPDDSYTSKWRWNNTPEDVGENINLTLDHWKEYNNTNKQPTSTNALLNGNDYHTPDYSESSGFGVIDFPMHWNFSNASGAFNIAKSGDKYYNDATWNVVYVDSHDYGPGTENRYNGGTQAWAENLNLMFTFRGIPCIYYGSEIEFKKGVKIDGGGDKTPLEKTGRAYFGDNIVGDVNATDFSEYTASGKVAETLNSPLAKHISRLNQIRRAIPALQKGQYSVQNVTGDMCYKRGYTNPETGEKSFVCVAVTNAASFKGIPNGKYIDAVTGDVKNVTDGNLSISAPGKGNLRVYVLSSNGYTGIDGKIGTDGTYLK